MTKKTEKRITPILTLVLVATVFGLPTFGQTTESDPEKVFLPLIYGPPPDPPAWIGPDGGKIIVAAIAPSQPEIIYAGTWGSGVFKSNDGGNTWAWKSQGLAAPYINSMVVDPKDPQTVYAGTYKEKVYKSTDGAESWFLSSNNIQEEAIVYSIAINPYNPDKIYIGTRGISNDGGPPWNGELYRTTDAGATWIPELIDLGGSLDQDWAYGIALHPENPSWIYAATHEHGVYRSTDAGRNWQPVNNGITNYSARGIVVDPHSALFEPTVYMGAWKYDGVFKTLDGGENWFFQNSSLGSRILTMSIDPVDSDNVYASLFPGGVLKTTNGGDNWYVTGLQDYEVINTAVNPVNPKFLYSGTNGDGLFRSFDRGSTWQLSQKGLHATQVSSLLVSQVDSRLFAGVFGDGVQQSPDGGENWSTLGSNLADQNILGLVANPADPNSLFALTETSGLFHCDLNSVCWKSIAINFPTTHQQQTIFGVDHPFTQLPFNDLWLDSGTKDLSVVADNPALLSMVFAPSNSQVAFLGTSGAGIYNSIDNGVTWQPSGLADKRIVSIAIHPQNSESIFAATPDRIFYSNDGGVTWSDLGLVGLEIFTLALDSNAKVYAGTSDGIYRYIINGWSPLALQGIAVTAINSHPTETDWLYAGTTEGLFISHNAGQTWESGPKHLIGLTIQSVSFDPVEPKIVFVSTTTHGVIRFVDID